MKKYLATMILSSFLIAGLYAQDLKSSNVPKEVKSAFLAKYPESTKFKAHLEKEKANFEANWGGKSGEDNSALFTLNGTFIELVKAISIGKSPTKALAYIKKIKLQSK